MAVSQIRTALGITHHKTAVSTWTALASIRVSAQATLLVTTAHDPASTTNVMWNGLSLTKDVSAVNVGKVDGSIWSLLSNPTSATASIAISWSGIDVTAKTLAAVQMTDTGQYSNVVCSP